MGDISMRGSVKPHLRLVRRKRSWRAHFMVPSRYEPGAVAWGAVIHGRYPVKWERIRDLCLIRGGRA